MTFVLRRLGSAVFVLLGVLVITFTLAHLISNNPLVAWLGRAASIHPELAEAYAARFHLNEPLYVQFWYYIVGLVQGDMGYSVLKGKPVAAAIVETLPFTLQILFFAFAMILAIGIPLGVVAGKYHNKGADYAIRAFYLVGTSSPVFFLALFLLILLSFTLRLMPSGHALSPGVSAPTPITHFQIIDCLLEGDYRAFGDALIHVLMPAMAMAFGSFGYVSRLLRASILEVMRTDYVRTARAKGVRERAVFFRHALRNAMIPVITLAAVIVTWLLAGSIFVETIFSYPGVGQYVAQALVNLDYPSLLGITLLFAVIIVISNFVADLLYAVADPRISLR